MCDTRSIANTMKDNWQSKTHFQITFIFSDVNVGARKSQSVDQQELRL
jgi:hypothetical protein